jgi:hypothetical protein
LGGGGGASFFSSFFFSSFLAYLAGAAVDAAGAGPLETPPKLKKDEISFPARALAKSLVQKASIFTPEAATNFEIFSPK